MTNIREVIDTTALGWVKPELDETLRQARQEIEDFVETPADTTRMRTCAALLHQVHGTLQMIELAAPALVAEEMERLAGALQQGVVSDLEEACSALLRGVVQLPDYLERLQGGHRDIPIVLLPLLNELRAARGETALSESALFASDMRQTFQLDAPAPTDAERAHAQASLTGRNRALLDTVSAAIKEDLLRVKDTLDLHLRTGRVDVNELKPQVDALAQVGDTLGMIGLTTARNVVLQQRDAMADIVSGARPADETALLDIAGALLYVDATLDEQVDSLGGGQTSTVDSMRGDAVASESRKVLDFVVREAIANFSDARQAFVAFVETGWDHAELTDVPRLLDEVAGALRIIEMQQPADYLVAIARFAEVELVRRRRVLQGAQLDKLADALASFEYFLEALRDQRPNREGILDIARKSLEELGYWPLPSAAALAAAGDVPAPVSEIRPQPVAPPVVDVLPVVPVSVDSGTAPPSVAPVPATPAPAMPAPISAGFEHSEDIDDDIREVFLEELQEEIANLGQLLPGWRAKPDEPEVLRPIRRVFHTLKGSGRLVGARTLGEFSWKIENMLNRVLDGTRPASPAVIALIAHAHAALPQLHAALASNSPVTADLAGIEAIAERLATGEEVQYVAPIMAVVTPVVAAPEPLVVAPEPVLPEVVVEDSVPASVDAVLLEILGTEVTGHLVTIDTWLAAANATPQPADDRLQRAIHTLNGAFAMTEVPVITDFTGPTEAYVKRLLAAHAVPSAEGIAALGAVATAIRRTLESLQATPQSVPVFAGLADRVSALRDSLPDTRGLPAEAHEDEDDSLIAINLSEFMPAAGVAEALKADRREADLAASELSGAVGIDAQAVEAARLEAERIEAERIEAERLEAERLEAQRLEAERLEAERLETERLEAERLEAERLEAERLEAERLEAERLEAERLEVERIEAERIEAERLEAERLEAERAEAERLELERLEAERVEAERLEAERLEAERLEAARLDAERVAAEEEAEYARLEAEYARAAEEARVREAEAHEAQLLDTERLAAEAREIARRDADMTPVAVDEGRDQHERPTTADQLADITVEEPDTLEVELGMPADVSATPLSPEDDRTEYERLSAEYAALAASITADDLDSVEADRREYERLSEEYAARAADISLADLDAVEADRRDYELLSAEYAARAADIALEDLDALDLEDEALAEPVVELPDLDAEFATAPASADDELSREYERLMAEYAAQAGDIGATTPADVTQPEDALSEDDEELRFEDEVEAPVDTAAVEAAAAAAAAAPSFLSQILIEADPDEALDLAELDPELVDIFVEEGGDLLDHSDGLLAKLREAPNERDTLVGLQRDLHTLKGGARMAGIMPVGELGHVMESLLEAVVENRTELGSDGVPLLERGFDRLHAMVTRVGDRRAVAMPASLISVFEARSRGQVFVPAPLETADSTVEAVESGSTPASRGIVFPPRPLPELKPLSAPLSDEPVEDDEIGVRAPQEQVRIRADLLDRLVNYAGEVAIYRARLEQQLGAFRGAIAEMEATNLRMRDQLRRLEIETEAQIIARYQREDTTDTTFDPLELDRFSTLQQLSRALSESAADQGSLQVTLDDLTRQYETLLLQQSRVSSELQEGLMRTRMVPFDGLLPRLRRVVRQASGETGKQVALKLEGTQGELDRNVLERMTAPLEHMLRNAIAHGLETPENRKAAGKSDEGTVRIAVRREGSEVVLEVADDGRGLDRAAIRRRGLERGLIRPDVALVDADLDLLIFEPGFSTADEVSRLAGRGVGMDVVASEVRQLGGTLDIHSVADRGTTFTLRLPQTLAVTQAVFVRVGETSFAVPIASVRGVGRLPREALIDAALADRDAIYRYGGEDYVVHDLGLLLGHGEVKAEGALQMPVLLIRSGDLRAAVLVDQVVGNREIVVKPVGPQVASIPGIFGATIMGDGRVVVILDVAPLVRRQAALPKGETVAPAPVVETRAVPLVMVVDDSVTMRKVTGRVLERHNFEVMTAKDGIDALERMTDRVPDLMLLDIEMPRMDGYELATAMKAEPRLRDVPIVMITSRTGDKHRERAFQIGVNRYLGKPYQEPELMRNVYELLGIARHHE